MASQKPIVTVVGATGHQGGSVVEFLRRENKYQIRGLTRKPEEEAAKKLKANGVEVVAADIAKKEDLQRAFKGSWAVFAVTQFWEHGESGELAQGKLMAEVAKEQGVKAFLYSSLPNVEKFSGGKISVPHFTGKAKIEEYARGLGFEYTAFPQPAAYFSNSAKEKNGVLELSMPVRADAPVDWIAISDYGAAVAGILNDLKKYNGKAIAVTSERATPEEIVGKIAKLTGKKTRFVPWPYDAAVAAGMKELADMFKWFEEYGYYGPGADLNEFRSMYPLAKNFEQFYRETNNLK